MKNFINTFQNCKYYIKSGDELSKPYYTAKGVTQGSSVSACLFNLFVSDLPQYLTQQGPYLNKTEIKYIQYADDLVLLASSAKELQRSIDDLYKYCNENCLSINLKKTKVLIMGLGRLAKCNFTLNGNPIEKVRCFKYLGFIFLQDYPLRST